MVIKHAESKVCNGLPTVNMEWIFEANNQKNPWYFAAILKRNNLFSPNHIKYEQIDCLLLFAEQPLSFSPTTLCLVSHSNEWLSLFWVCLISLFYLIVLKSNKRQQLGLLSLFIDGSLPLKGLLCRSVLESPFHRRFWGDVDGTMALAPLIL